MFRTLTSRQLAFDVTVAALCLLFRVAMQPESAAVWIVIVAMAAALALRRLSPGLALAIAWVGALVQMVALLPPDISNTAVLAVLFTTARYGTRLVSRLGFASAVAGAVIATAYLVLGPSLDIGGNAVSFHPPNGAQLVFTLTVGLGSSLALLGLSWTLGLLARTWADARDSRRRRLAAEQTVVVEQERNRIARDMHDVVAHSLAVVIAQADGARYAAAKDPAAVEGALATIAATAREALGDVRLLLGQFRQGEEPGPQPMLEDLDRLVESLRASGLAIELERQGDAPVLPAGVQLALYRIVQEALTNALRHGDATRPVRVLLQWRPDAATLTISNALVAPATAPAAPGHGIAGMRERAILVGGTLSATADGDRFVVSSRIPVGP